MTKEYTLIPLSEITKDAREIAVAWIEGYEDWMKSDLPTKHKLASDIMNYANEQNQHLTTEATRLREALEKIANDDQRYAPLAAQVWIDTAKKVANKALNPQSEIKKCGKCEMLGDSAPCDECYRKSQALTPLK